VSIVGTYIFERERVRIIAVLSPSMILVNCSESWNQLGEFRIIKLEYLPIPKDSRPFLKRDPKYPANITIACNLTRDLGLKKEIQTAKVVKKAGFVALLYDNNWVILIQTSQQGNWKILDRYDCANRMPNASITSINLIKGTFLIIGSRI
jgi:hypothetical protein